MKFFEIEKRRYGAIVKFHNDYDDNNDDDGDGDENDDDYDDNDDEDDDNCDGDFIQACIQNGYIDFFIH